MSFRMTVELPVAPDEAFALLTDPERLRRWQTVCAVVDLRAGGAYRWTVNPGHVAAGTFREVDPGRRIVFGWGWEGSDDLPPDTSTVTVTIEPGGVGRSVVTLAHAGLAEDQETAHAQGWTHYLARLERLAATGDAGADEWSSAPDHLTPVTAAQAGLAAVQPVLRAVTPDDRARPTPCSELTCHDLVEHLVSSLGVLGAMAGATVRRPETGGPEDVVSVVAGQVIDAWALVDLEGTVPGPGGEPMSARLAAGLLPLELALHGWDLAQGIGRPLHLSDRLVDYLTGLAQSVVPGERGRAFAEEVPAPDGANALDRLVAYTGRTPLVVHASAPADLL